jgi:hypothetical protein
MFGAFIPIQMTIVVVVVPLLVWSVLVGQAMFTGCCSEDSLGECVVCLGFFFLVYLPLNSVAT